MATGSVGSAPPGRTLAQLAAIGDLSDEAKELLTPELRLDGYVQALMGAELAADAVRILALVLPTREAVWWAWMCARRASGEEPTPEVAAALLAIERWLREPSDENRRATMTAGDAADFATPAGCVALATFFSGGSVAPPDAPYVPPQEFVAGKTIAAAILLSAVVTEPELAPEKLNGFLEQGIHVAKRVGLWPAQTRTVRGGVVGAV
jgi:hypothetical protein